MPRRLRWIIGSLLGIAAIAVVALLVIIRKERGSGVEAQADMILTWAALSPGDSVAELGAGDGRLARLVAGRLDPRSRFFLTELEPSKLDSLRRVASKFPNMSVLSAGETSTNLPLQCCSTIYIRRVYHHFSDPQAMVRSIHQSLRPGGRLIVIDFVTPWFTPWNRQSWSHHGIAPERVIDQLTAGGFVFERRVESWIRRDYWLVFRKPA